MNPDQQEAPKKKAKASRKKTGRPTKYTKALATEFCSRLVDGTSVRTVCLADDMPTTSTIFKWLSEKPEFSDQYAKSKEMASEALAEEIFDISDNGTNDWMEMHDKDGECIGYKVNGEALQRSRLRVDTRKWYLSKIVPKKYGDKIQTENLNKNLDISELDDDELDRRLKQLEGDI